MKRKQLKIPQKRITLEDQLKTAAAQNLALHFEIEEKDRLIVQLQRKLEQANEK